jgi:hypothetical protein
MPIPPWKTDCIAEGLQHRTQTEVATWQVATTLINAVNLTHNWTFSVRSRQNPEAKCLLPKGQFTGSLSWDESTYKIDHNHILVHWNWYGFGLTMLLTSCSFWAFWGIFGPFLHKMANLRATLWAQMLMNVHQIKCWYDPFFKYFHATMTIF